MTTGEMILGLMVGLSLLSVLTSALVVLWFHRVGPGTREDISQRKDHIHGIRKH